MGRLHVITGPSKTGKSTRASEMQRNEPAAEWKLYDGPMLISNFQAAIATGNVIVVIPSDDEIEVTTEHMVPLPATFGSLIVADVENATPTRQTLILGDGKAEPRWMTNAGGDWFKSSELRNIRVIFTAPKEA